MLTREQMILIDTYVQDEYYDKEKLIKYLNMHSIVGNEVFDYVDRKNRELNRKEAHSMWLDDEEGYQPIDVDIFVKRIPFYFYTWDGNVDTCGEDIGHVIASKWEELKTGEITLEYIYEVLEYMFYEKKIPLYKIFNYMTEQTGLVTEKYFFEWVEYLKLCEELKWDDLMPDNFIVAYNHAREAVGLEPMIFIPDWDMHMEKPYYKNGAILTFEGVFPTDSEGNPIMRWIGLKILNGAQVIKGEYTRAKGSHLRLKVNPKTVIYYKDNDQYGDFWNQIYAGPLTMEFDHTVLKERREALGYTQQEVADAIGANIRTYQKWEYGNTQPDGYYLLRLMNWLDISDVQETIKFDIPED